MQNNTGLPDSLITAIHEWNDATRKMAQCNWLGLGEYSDINSAEIIANNRMHGELQKLRQTHVNECYDLAEKAKQNG